MPKPNAAALLAELRAFASLGTSLPASLPLDAARVLSGAKQLLSETDSFHFSCTSCGACCRSYSSTVLLDPMDVSLLSSQLPVAQQPYTSGSSDVSALFPRHTVRRIGSFHLEALPSAPSLPGLLSGLPITRASGTAPVLYLRPLGRGRHARCSFSTPGPSPGSLLCSLGKAHMPLACSLYPLGSFRAGYFSLDDPHSCEGAAPAAGLHPRTVGQYLHSSALQPRLQAAAWWQALATGWACSGIEADVARLGPAALPPPSWPACGPLDPPGAGGAPSLLLQSLRAQLRGIWYSARRQWTEAAAQEEVQAETLALFEKARRVAPEP
jgi:Fe-S-cluster containining protein